MVSCLHQGREKCDHYWPYDTQPVYYGDIQVTILNESQFPDWTVSEFRVCKVRSGFIVISAHGATREIVIKKVSGKMASWSSSAFNNCLPFMCGSSGRHPMDCFLTTQSLTLPSQYFSWPANGLPPLHIQSHASSWSWHLSSCPHHLNWPLQMTLAVSSIPNCSLKAKIFRHFTLEYTCI